MRQAIMTKPGTIEFHEVPEPGIAADEVLLRIKRIGICGSDIHVYHGEHPFTSYPVVQGHEYCGIIEAVGSDVAGFEPGQLATARPQRVCGTCAPRRRGDYNVCEALRVEGFQAVGCAQELFAVPAERAIALPQLTPDQGAFVEPVAVACHATSRAAGLADKNIVVMGAGTIGNLIAQMARAHGARQVLSVDLSEHRLQAARACGVDHVSCAGREGLERAIERAFGDAGFQIGFEAAGAEESLSGLIGSIEKGGEVVIVGVFGQKPRLDMSVICEHEIAVRGSMMYKQEDYVRAAGMIAAGEIETDALISRHFEFEQFLQAYQYIESQGDRTLKVMIDL